MTIIKCKMCGGDLSLAEGSSTAKCEFCGSVQTIPNLDDEKKLIQFERAERLRKQCEFDKAAGIYETIVADFRREAEAYWGLVLCKFGIEYVDDPATGKKIPTCHRSSFDSILDDSDFEQALENADPAARKVYREEAKQIEEIRKGIVAVSNNEQPYDLFICYKETGENGDRTLDSVLAQDIYDALTSKGYRVFFARITLEDKLGMEYEPYIFAALNSAKIMLAVGTDYEYFNAVWVKNEWSRYLKLMAKDKDKHLIPCFKGIDAYDMPREFARLQAQDLGKVGAMQDLLRGIDKILPRQQQNTTVIQERVVVGGGGSNKIASLLDRGNMALEDGDWAKADSFFEDVLNNDSKNAQAYLGKTLAQEKCRTIDAFVRKRKDASQAEGTERLRIQPASAHIDQIVQQYSVPGYVSGQDVRNLYQFDLSYATTVPCRKKQYRQEETYWAEHKLLSKAEKFAVGAVAENLQREKKALFAALSERVKKAETAEAAAQANVQQRYDVFVAQADQKAAKLYEDGLKARESYYQTLLQTVKTATDVKILTQTAQQFAELGDYQDSKDLAEHCRKRADEEQAKLDAQAEQQRLIKLRQEKERRAKVKRNLILVCLIASMAIAFIVVWNTFIVPMNQYNDALAFMDARNYEDAIAIFEDLEDYKDSKLKIEACRIGILDQKYEDALALMEEGQYNEAIVAFRKIEEHRDSKIKIEACQQAIQEEKYEERYQHALSLMSNQKFTEAIHAFEELNGYKDSVQKIEECKVAIYEGNYQDAIVLMEAGKFEEAIAAFRTLNGYKDSIQKILECEAGIYEGKYQEALALMETKKYEQAIAAFEALNGYKDSIQKIKECKAEIYEGNYQDALALMKAKEYSKAIKVFEALNGYKDSIEKIAQCQAAIQQQNAEKLETQYNSAQQLLNQGNAAKAAIAFAKLGDYKDAKALALSLWKELISQQTITGGYNTLGVKTDGTVIAIGEDGGRCNVSSWKNIISISANSYHTVGLKADGTVVATGDAQWGNESGQCNVSGWKDITAISTGVWITVGLKSDGTVVVAGDSSGLKNLSSWKNIVAIGAGSGHVVGLRADGTVVATGNNKYGQCNVSTWKDIIAICVGSNHTIGLKADGTVVAVGSNSDDQCQVSTWKDIVAISAGDSHTIGLKADGTVVAVGWNAYGQCNIINWTGIIAISAGASHSIGLKADGTVVAVGNNSYGQCNVDDWTNIKAPN